MYAPPVTRARFSAGTTCRYDRSLEIRLSVSKLPPGSDSSRICLAKLRRRRFWARRVPWNATIPAAMTARIASVRRCVRALTGIMVDCARPKL